MTTLAQLQAAIRGKPEVPPKHMRTSVQWAKVWGKSESHTGMLIRHAVERKVLVMAKYRVQTPSGIIRPIPHYGPKK
jgi:hypothetical protein